MERTKLIYLLGKNEKKIIKEKIWLQFTQEEAAEWNKENQ